MSPHDFALLICHDNFRAHKFPPFHESSVQYYETRTPQPGAAEAQLIAASLTPYMIAASYRMFFLLQKYQKTRVSARHFFFTSSLNGV
jgi:hypothetical protein